MSEHVKELLTIHNRRLQKLQLQQAKFGINTPPHILIEIEDTEAEIERVRALGAEEDRLKNNLVNLDDMGKQGLSVTELQEQVRQQLAEIVQKLGVGNTGNIIIKGDIITGTQVKTQTIFDQRQQQVDNQTNIAGDNLNAD